MSWRAYEAGGWLEFTWSEWGSLNPSAEALADVPTDPGLYRVRHLERDGLTYIGETGRSLRGRIRALARGVYAEEMPYRDPHVGAPCHWAVHQEDGPEFEVSYTTPSAAADKAKRKSMEAACIASYRRAVGESPTCAFSRMIPGYSTSSYRRDEERGGPLGPNESESYADPGIPPLDWTNPEDPTAANWMGFEWTTPQPLSAVSADIPTVDGVYRIWDPSTPLPLEYLGESANLRSRLRTHGRDRRDDLVFSYAAPDTIDAKHTRLEAETDLIGAHWLATGAPPSDQH